MSVKNTKKATKAWEFFEEDVANYFNGYRQAGSGNSSLATKKGDIRCEDYLIECKYTSKECYTLDCKTWEKIVEEAIGCGKIPLFACRSQAGDFALGYQLDFDIDKPTIENCKRVKIMNEFSCDLIGDINTHSVVCWRLGLSDID